MALTDDLVSFWSLEESTGSRLDSHGSNHMGEVGILGSVSGKVGVAASFVNGQSNYLSISSNSDFSGLGGASWTFCGWIYRTQQGTSYPTIFSKIGPNHAEYIFFANGTSLYLDVYSLSDYNGYTQLATAADTSLVDTWDFFVVWNDASNNTINIELNSNGTVYSTTHVGGVYAGTDNFEIGRQGAYNRVFDGYIDQVGLWHRVLTSDERAQLYNGGSGLSYSGMLNGTNTASDGLENLRRSILGIGLPWNVIPPIPDTLISKVGNQDDRKHVAGYYRKTFLEDINIGNIYDLSALFESASHQTTIANLIKVIYGRFDSTSRFNASSSRIRNISGDFRTISNFISSVSRKRNAQASFSSISHFISSPTKISYIRPRFDNISSFDFQCNRIRNTQASFNSISSFVNSPTKISYIGSVFNSDSSFNLYPNRLRNVGASFESLSNMRANSNRLINQSTRFESRSGSEIYPIRVRQVGIMSDSSSRIACDTSLLSSVTAAFSSSSAIDIDYSIIGEVQFTWEVQSQSDMKLSPSVISNISPSFHSRSHMGVSPIRFVHMNLNQASRATMEIGTTISRIKEILASFESRNDFSVTTEISRPPIDLLINMMSESSILFSTSQIINVGSTFSSQSDIITNPTRVISTSPRFDSKNEFYIAPIRVLNNGAVFASLADLNIETEHVQYAAEIGVILDSSSDFRLTPEIIRNLSIILRSNSGMQTSVEVPNDLVLTPVEFELLLTKMLNFNLYRGNR